jgi:hypothetical protein
MSFINLKRKVNKLSVATDKLRTLFNGLTTGEDVSPEVKSQVALALDALVDVETEVYNAEDSKSIAVRELDEVKEENKRLREYNSQLTMKLGTAVAQAESNSDDEPDEPEEDDDSEFDEIIENYEIK